MLQHYTGFCSGLPGHADVIMGRQFLSCSFLWKRSTNSLWLSSRLKVRLKLVSNTWWTPATIAVFFKRRLCLNPHFIVISCFTLLYDWKKYFCTLIFVTHQGFWRNTWASCLPRCCWGHSVLPGRLWTAVTLTPPPPFLYHSPGKESKWCIDEYSETNIITIIFERLQKQSWPDTIFHKHSNTCIHLYLVVFQHFKELLVALLCDEDTLSGGDAATACQTVIQCDLCFFQLLPPTILQAHGKLTEGKW